MHRTKYFGSNEKKEDSHFSATNESIIIPIIIILYRFSWKDERNIKVGNNDIERHHIDSESINCWLEQYHRDRYQTRHGIDALVTGAQAAQKFANQ
jgi:hypothetical protein